MKHGGYFDGWGQYGVNHGTATFPSICLFTLSQQGTVYNCPPPLTVSHGSAYTVVRATQQVNGKWQFGDVFIIIHSWEACGTGDIPV